MPWRRPCGQAEDNEEDKDDGGADETLAQSKPIVPLAHWHSPPTHVPWPWQPCMQHASVERLNRGAAAAGDGGGGGRRAARLTTGGGRSAADIVILVLGGGDDDDRKAWRSTAASRGRLNRSA